MDEKGTNTLLNEIVYSMNKKEISYRDINDVPEHTINILRAVYAYANLNKVVSMLWTNNQEFHNEATYLMHITDLTIQCKNSRDLLNIEKSTYCLLEANEEGTIRGMYVLPYIDRSYHFNIRITELINIVKPSLTEMFENSQIHPLLVSKVKRCFLAPKSTNYSELMKTIIQQFNLKHFEFHSIF